MANEIYKSSWWGDAYNTASTLVQNPPLPNLEAFKIRVASDNGVYEDNDVVNTITSINPMLFDSQFIYVDRVEKEIAIVEDTYNLALKINKIANI